MELQLRIYNYLEHPNTTKLGNYVQFFIFFNILVSITILFLQTEKSLKEYSDIFSTINNITLSIFLIEYIFRQYSAGVNSKYRGFFGRIKFSLTPFMLLDLIVLLPFFLSFLGVELSFLRSLRFIRIFRIFRLAKFTEFDEMIVSICKEHKEEFFYILSSSFFLLIVLSSLVYYFENPVQPEVFSSMTDTMWWAIITFTTVGYGDMYPVTAGGKILTTITAVLGIAFYAIPGSIFTSSLIEKLEEKKRKKQQ